MSTTTVALTPPVWGSLSAGYRSISSHSARPSASGGGDRVQHLLQGRPVVAGQGALDVRLAVPVVVAGEVTRLGRGCFFLLQQRGFAGVGLLGGDHLEQPLAQPPQCLRVVVARQLEQVRLGPAEVLGTEVVGEQVDGPDDHAGLLGLQVPGGECGPGGRVRLEVTAQPHRRVGGRPGGPGLVRQPVRRRTGAAVLADVKVVGVRGDPGLQLGGLRDQPAQLDQGRGGLGGVHRPHRRIGHRVGGLTHPRGRRRHPVPWCGHRCHGTHSSTRRRQSIRPEPLIHKGSGSRSDNDPRPLTTARHGGFEAGARAPSSTTGGRGP
jgi:hypothetical protein